MLLGQIIRRWRINAERDVRDIAAEIGISSSTLTRLEGGQTPAGDTLAAVIHWLTKPGAPVAATPPPADETK